MTNVQTLRSIWPVAAFTAAYLAVAGYFAVAVGNREFLFYIGIMLVLLALVWVVHLGVNLSQGTLWALSVWGLAHMAGGLVPVPAGWPVDAGSQVLYSLWLVPEALKYDQVVHAFGFGVATWVCWQGIAVAIARRSGTRPAPSAGLLVLAVLAGMGLGALNELVEFIATLVIPETNVGGYLNTGFDLVANSIGASAAAVLICLHHRQRRPR